MYADGQPIWPVDDLWHQHTRSQLEQFTLQHAVNFLHSATNVLDVGCGRDHYEWMPRRTINLDRFFSQVQNRSKALVADLERLPFHGASFDLVICIGSVLNYVSAVEAIAEIARVTALGGHAILHFETSSSFEQLGTRRWNSSVHLYKTINSSRSDFIWLYSPSFVNQVIDSAGFKILKMARFHILSALLTRIGVSHNKAVFAAKFDPLVPWLRQFADDRIILVEKI